MYIYYPGHVPYLLPVQVGGSSCQSRVMPRHRRGRVLACNKKKLQEAFPFFSSSESCAVLCSAFVGRCGGPGGSLDFEPSHSTSPRAKVSWDRVINTCMCSCLHCLHSIIRYITLRQRGSGEVMKRKRRGIRSICLLCGTCY